MPVVERYNSPQVTNRALPDTSANLSTRGAFGSQLGSGLMQAAGTAQAIGLDMQQQDDMAAIKEATSAYRKEVNDVTFLSEGAYYNLQGKAAYDGFKPTETELEKRRSKIAEGLSPRQRDQFMDISGQYIDRELDSMSRHAAKGRSTWLNEQDESTIILAQQDGSLRWNDADEYSKQIKGSVANLAKRNGWTPERTEIETESRLTAMHKSALDNILVQDPKSAPEYFKKHMDEISPSVRDDIQKVIDGQLNAQWVQDNSDEIRIGGGGLTARMSKVRELTKDDPERRKLLTSQIEHDYRLEKAAESEAQADAYDQAAQMALDGMSGNDIRFKNPTLWNQLSGSQRISLSKGTDAKTDLRAWYEYNGLKTQDPQKAMDYILENPDKFSYADTKSAISDFNKPAKPPKNIITDKAAFDTSMEGLIGKEPTDGKARQNWNRQYNVLVGAYQQRMEDYKEANNIESVPAQDRRKILDEFQIEMLRKDTLFGVDWLNPDEEVSLNDIPVDELEAIRNEVEKQGFPVTPENILKTYTSEDWKSFWQN